MIDTAFAIILGLFGLILGSFAGATVWRLRARQLIEDKAEGEEFDKHELKKLQPLTKRTLKNDRSQCLHCGHQLQWYDLIPLVSWVSTRGKCRYCHKPIGKFEPLIELGMAAVFVSSYIFWPYLLVSPLDWAQFALWLIACVMMTILFAYDFRWFILPDKVVFPLIVTSAVWALMYVFNSPLPIEMLINIAISVVILSGLYFALWLYSKGRWIGFGDVKLCIALALLVVEWPLAFLVLLLANLIGCFIVIPGMIMGKITRTTHVPFGPLLLLATFIAVLFGNSVIAWYMQATFSLAGLFGL